MNKLIKGQKYDVTTLMLDGWTDEQTATDGGYQLRNYFDSEGRYLGPDSEGVEPLVTQGVQYRITEEGGASKTIVAASMDEACDEARNWVRDGDYSERGTVRVSVTQVTDAAYPAQKDFAVAVG